MAVSFVIGERLLLQRSITIFNSTVDAVNRAEWLNFENDTPHDFELDTADCRFKNLYDSPLVFLAMIRHRLSICLDRGNTISRIRWSWSI